VKYKIYNQIKRILKPYYKWELIGIIITLMYASFSYLTPMISRYLVDEVMPAKSYEKLTIGIILFVVVCLLQPLTAWIKDRIFLYITENVTYDTRKKLFDNIISSKYSNFEKIKGGEFVSIVTNDGRMISNFVSNIFAIFINNGLTITMILIGMFLISWKISLIVIVLFGIFMLINKKYQGKIRFLSKTMQENYDYLCTCIEQTNSSILSIKINNQETSTKDRFEKIISKMKKDNIDYSKINIFINNITMIIVVVCLGIIYGFGSVCVIEGTLTIGDVIALGLYFQMLSGPLYSLMGIGISSNTIIPIFKRIDNYTRLEKENLYKGYDMSDFTRIDIRNLSFSYPNSNKNIIDNMSFILSNKGLVLFQGKSGVGKTTMLKILMGIYDIDCGQVFYGDNDINNLSRSSLRKMISYVPQENTLLNESIIDNIRYGNDSITNEEIYDVCKKINMHEKILKLDKGYNSIVNEKNNLSGGECQRILFARGVLKNSKILILDEPLANIDDKNCKSIISMINEIAKEKLVILISHQREEEFDIRQKILF